MRSNVAFSRALQRVGCKAWLGRIYTDSRRTFAMRVCHPGPVAFQRASVSGDNLRLIATFDSGDLGRPRGLSILAAVRAPKIFGRTALAGRAFAIMASVHSGLIRPLFLDLGCFFIPFHLAPIGLSKTDDSGFAFTWREHHAMQPIPNETKHTVAPLSIVFAPVFPDQGR